MNGERLYHTDTPTQQIMQYAFDAESGRLGPARPFVHTAAAQYPDGSCVDAQDCLWNAQWGGSQVIRYTSNGSLDTVIDLPVTQPTCTAIGGENLDLLFISSARQDLSVSQLAQQPKAGSLFIYQIDACGVIDQPFQAPPRVADEHRVLE